MEPSAQKTCNKYVQCQFYQCNAFSQSNFIYKLLLEEDISNSASKEFQHDCTVLNLKSDRFACITYITGARARVRAGHADP